MEMDSNKSHQTIASHKYTIHQIRIFFGYGIIHEEQQKMVWNIFYCLS